MNLSEILTPCETSVHAEMSFENYAAISALNASLLRVETAAEMKHAMQPKAAAAESMTDSKMFALSRGELLHSIILEPHTVSAKFLRFEETKGLTTVKAQACRAANPGRVLVSQKMIDDCQRARDVVYSSALPSYLLNKKGERELSFVYWDPAFAVRRKFRADVVPDDGDWILDIKSTSKPLTENAGRNMCFDFGYDVAAAYYLDGARAVYNDRLPFRRFLFLAVYFPEDGPILARVYGMEEGYCKMLDTGRGTYKRRTGTFREAVESGKWLGFESQTEAVVIE